jgi:hypothetical protein
MKVAPVERDIYHLSRAGLSVAKPTFLIFAVVG